MDPQLQQVITAVQDNLQPIFDRLQNDINQLRVENQQLRVELHQLRSTPTPTSQKKPRLPDPTKFDGKQYKFKVWLPEIKAKLQVDGEAIGDNTAQFYYVYGNLESTVQATVLPQLSYAEKQKSWDYNTILEQLERVNDNPNAVQEAEDALQAIKQGDQPLPSYIARFERLLYEAEGQDWADANKIITFRSGLSPALRKALSHQLNLPATYPAFISVVQQLSRRQGSYGAPSQPPPHQGSSKDQMDLSAIDINTLKTTSRRARSTSAAKREEWRITGRCIRCGSSDHWIDYCPLAPAKDRSRSPQACQKFTARRDSDNVIVSDTESDSSLEEHWRRGPLFLPVVQPS